jgi:hypothetical protein
MTRKDQKKIECLKIEVRARTTNKNSETFLRPKENRPRPDFLKNLILTNKIRVNCGGWGRNWLESNDFSKNSANSETPHGTQDTQITPMILDNL